jgi:uncharacterized membrane protein
MDVERQIRVVAPIAKVYECWTRFEDFPSFMAGIIRVTRLGDDLLFWQEQVDGRNKEWVTRVTWKSPGEGIAWRSEGNTARAVEVTLKALDDRHTLVKVHKHLVPDDFGEAIRGTVGVEGGFVDDDLRRFKALVESTPMLVKRDVAAGAG